MRICPSVLAFLATVILAASCSSAKDATGPGSAGVTLTESTASLTDAGAIILVANPTAGTVQKVEFYGRRDADTLSRLATVTSAPYQLQRQMQFEDNGSWEFLAKAYEANGEVLTSNSVKATVAIVDTRPLTATFAASQDRITRPGQISFTVTANKMLARIEVDRGDTKVAELLSPQNPGTVGVTVSAADNGTPSYVVKAIDPSGSIVSSAPLTVTVDIRWDLIKNVADLPNGGVGGFAIAREPSGGYYIAVGTLSNDIALVKSDESGNQIWTRTFGGPGLEEVTSVTVDPEGFVYVIGMVSHNDQPGQPPNCLLLRYDAAGALLRTQILNPGTGSGSCVGTTDREGNVYVAGRVDNGTSYTDFLTKYDHDGNATWTRQFASDAATNSDFLTSIAYDPLGDGVYVAGYTSGSFDGAAPRGAGRDTYVLKFDANGNRVWTSQYGIPGLLTFGLGLAADPNGGVYVNVATDAAERFTAEDVLVLRLDAAGTVVWAKRLDSGGADNPTAITADSKAVYVAGYIHDGDTQHDFTEPTPATGGSFLTKIAPDGTSQFIRLLAPALIYSELVTPAGDVIVAGHVAGPVSIARHHDPTP
jgi:hypothetical protein